MENNALSNRVLEILEWDSILKELDSRCETSNGKKIIASLKPLSIDQIKIQLKEISELKGLMSLGESPDFSGITDIEPYIHIIQKDGVLQIEDLCLIKDFVIVSNRIISFINIHKKELKSVSEEFNELNKTIELRDLLTSSITENNELNTNKYKELKLIKDQLTGIKNDIEKKLHNIIHSPSKSSSLQEKIYTIRNDRYVILVKSDMKGNIKGTMHDISSSGATLYIEPNEIINLNNKLIMLERDFNIEIKKILRQLSKETAKYSDELLQNLALLAYLDFLTAAAKFSIAIKGDEPEIPDEKIIELYDARHPLLFLMNPGNIVPNDISVGKDFSCMIISGANTGGKTVLLKTVGLCVLLIMHGLHIPASPDSRLGIFSNILADIGDDQNIVQSLSTYSGQIVIINDMIASSNKNTLVLIDELLVGTNPRQGAVLAQAVLEALVETNAIILLTTHYSELKDLPSFDKRLINASVSFDVEALKPTYKLRTGLPGTSYTVEIAKNYGLREDIIQRSKQLLGKREASTESLLEDIQKHKQEIDEEYEKLDKMKHELAIEKSEYLENKKKFNMQIEDFKNERGIEFIDEINRYRNEIALRIKNLRNESLRENENAQKDLANIQENISKSLKRDRKKRFINTYESLTGQEKAGDKVFVVPLEKTGIIDELDKVNQSAVIILGNSIRSRFSFNDLLAPINKKENTKHGKEKNAVEQISSNMIPVTLQTSFNTSDLRGMRVEEALRKIEMDLDRMIRDNIHSAVVIHGHGTGALKNAVRQWLKFSYYVRNFRPGEQNEGGDGVSIVLLNK